MPAPSSSSKQATTTLVFLFLYLTCLTYFPTFSVGDNNLQFSFSNFQSNDPSLSFSQSANVDNQALQVTRNSGSSDVSNSSGQITSANSLRLWDGGSGKTASFNTSLLINMGPILDGGKNLTGGGMAFILSSVSATQVPNSWGKWLGLFNGEKSPLEQQAKVVAVELDTFKDSFDPDANHVGIDVNGSVDSIYTVSLSPYNVILDGMVKTYGTNTSVWIDYDGQNHMLYVYLANQGSVLGSKPARPVVSGYPIDLRVYLPETVYVGFSASTGTFIESHCVIQWTFSSSDLPSHTVSTEVIVGVSIAGAVVAIAAVSVVIFVALRRRKRWTQFVLGDLENVSYGPRKFSYRELKRATKGFSEECKLGQGGFGSVYLGILRTKNGITKKVAVKCLSQVSKQGESEFKAEVMSMGRMKHRNLVPLLGWSYERYIWAWSRKLILVYEYMPNGSLDQWIGRQNVEGMEWNVRYHVMKGLAAGLLYLHEEWEMVVVHRDLKPSNVMLDGEFNARLGDFGLAKLIDYEQDFMQTVTIAGTPGYIAPECLDQGIVSKESDMYSFGAIIIELATGHRLSVEYLHSLSVLLEKSTLEEAADPCLPSFDAAQLAMVLKLGLACCHPYPSARPTIRNVSHALSSSSSFDMPAMPSRAVLTSLLSLDDPLTSSIVPMDITSGR